jgi:hypothetical protein
LDNKKPAVEPKRNAEITEGFFLVNFLKKKGAQSSQEHIERPKNHIGNFLHIAYAKQNSHACRCPTQQAGQNNPLHCSFHVQKNEVYLDLFKRKGK